jgi:glucose/arabinose dehydrogenase
MQRLFFILASVCALLVAACNGEDPSNNGRSSPSQPEATAPGASSTDPSGIPPVRLQRVFPNVSLQRVTGLYQSTNGRWFALEQAGRVLVFPDQQDAQARVFLDLTNKVSTAGNEEGLLGMALAPDFAQSGVFYLYYAAANPRRTVLSRFQSTGDTANAASERVLLEVSQPFPNHKGGQIGFGPDGFLYVALGDGGSARDPMGHGQDLSTLLGSILRIDVSGNGGYSSPPDNPFAGRQAAAEIWAYGLRNPWRFSFDQQTGDLWASDAGQNAREEIDLIVKGGNYGWAIMEGSQCLGGGDGCNRNGLIAPVLDYSAGGENCAAIGGFVYRGQAIAGLRGAYVFADYCSGVVSALRKQGNTAGEEGPIAEANFQISSFGQGNDGELYALEHSASGGGIHKLVP